MVWVKRPYGWTWFNHEDFTWQVILRIYIKLLWNCHLLSYFPLIHRCGINANLLLLTFSHAKFKLFFCKMLTTELISYETANELSIYAKLCRNVTSFYRQETSKQSFSSSCFIANGNRMKIYGISYTEVFNEHYT